LGACTNATSRRTVALAESEARAEENVWDDDPRDAADRAAEKSGGLGYAALSAVGVVARLAFLGALGFVVSAAVVHFRDLGQPTLEVASALFFPATFLIYPWTHSALGVPLWSVTAGGGVAYMVSVLCGMRPADPLARRRVRGSLSGACYRPRDCRLVSLAT
jgi:hypothetical protein